MRLVIIVENMRPYENLFQDINIEVELNVVAFIKFFVIQVRHLLECGRLFESSIYLKSNFLQMIVQREHLKALKEH